MRRARRQSERTTPQHDDMKALHDRGPSSFSATDDRATQIAALLIAIRAPWPEISAKTRRSRGAVQAWRELRAQPSDAARRALVRVVRRHASELLRLCDAIDAGQPPRRPAANGGEREESALYVGRK